MGWALFRKCKCGAHLWWTEEIRCEHCSAERAARIQRIEARQAAALEEKRVDSPEEAPKGFVSKDGGLHPIDPPTEEFENKLYDFKEKRWREKTFREMHEERVRDEELVQRAKELRRERMPRHYVPPAKRIETQPTTRSARESGSSSVEDVLLMNMVANTIITSEHHHSHEEPPSDMFSGGSSGGGGV